MAKLTPLGLLEAQTFGSHLGLEITHIEALDSGSVNSNFELRCADGSRYFARIYEEQSEEGAQAERRVLRELSVLGVPTALPLTTEEGGGLCLHRGKPLGFYPWVAGVHLCNDLVTPDRARKLGETLASVHLASASLTQIPEGRFGLDGIRERLLVVRRATDRFDSDIQWIEERLNKYESARDANLPVGLVHGDLFRDNVLWQGDELAALLDFESACAGPFIYDLCVCLLAWCYTDSFQLDKVRAMVAGYRSVRELSDAEVRSVRIEGALACLRFASTRLTDFSLRTAPGTEPTRSYKRFLDRLRAVESGALDSLQEEQ